MTAFTRLSDADLREMVSALRSRRVSAPYSELQVNRVLSPNVAAEVTASLNELASMGFGEQQIATTLDLLLTDRSSEQIEAHRATVARGEQHPMEAKKELAGAIVAEFHSEEDADEARREFERVFSARDLPSEIPELGIELAGPTVLLSKLLVEAGLAASNSEARRLIKQGGVKVDGEQIRDPKSELEAERAEPVLIQCGKRRVARIEILKSNQ